MTVGRMEKERVSNTSVHYGSVTPSLVVEQEPDLKGTKRLFPISAAITLSLTALVLLFNAFDGHSTSSVSDPQTSGSEGHDFLGSAAVGDLSEKTIPKVTFDNVDCGSNNMKLMCLLSLSTTSFNDHMNVSVMYYRSSETKSQPLWTASTPWNTSVISKIKIPMYRLRVDEEYTAKVHIEVAGETSFVCTSTFRSSKTDYDFLDKKPFANVTNYKGPPGFDVLMTDMGESHDDFQGIIMIDNEGYVVWYYYSGHKTGAFDQDTDTYSFGMLLFPANQTSNGYISTELRYVASNGDLLDSYQTKCAGGGENYVAVTHECRAVGEGKFVSVLQTANPTEVYFHGQPYQYYMSEQIVAWDALNNSNNVNVLGSIDEFIKINEYPGAVIAPEIANSVVIDAYTCDPDVPDTQILDWSHISAVKYSTAYNQWIVSFRTLNAVVAFDYNFSKIEWAVSSGSLESDYHFKDVNDAFYDAHEASVSESAEGGKVLLLIDDGNNRPGCTSPWPKNCFSRAIEYTLDDDTHSAKVTWQFEFPYTNSSNVTQTAGEIVREDLWQLDGGSVTLMPLTGRYITAFTGTYGKSNPYLGKSWIFDVDHNGDVWSEIVVPGTEWKSGSYRAIPLNSIRGESSSCPLITFSESKSDEE